MGGVALAAEVVRAVEVRVRAVVVRVAARAVARVRQESI